MVDGAASTCQQQQLIKGLRAVCSIQKSQQEHQGTSDYHNQHLPQWESRMQCGLMMSQASACPSLSWCYLLFRP
jgi:hypothetical protein